MPDFPRTAVRHAGEGDLERGFNGSASPGGKATCATFSVIATIV
jgi:hypothetical protein